MPIDTYVLVYYFISIWYSHLMYIISSTVDGYVVLIMLLLLLLLFLRVVMVLKVPLLFVYIQSIDCGKISQEIIFL